MSGFSSQRIPPSHWLMAMGIVTVFGMAVSQLFGVRDVLKAFQVIVLGQAFLFALGLLFLSIVDAVVGSDEEREAAANRAVWFSQSAGRSEIWEAAVQSHLREVWNETTIISESIAPAAKGSIPFSGTLEKSSATHLADASALRRGPAANRHRRAA